MKLGASSGQISRRLVMVWRTTGSVPSQYGRSSAAMLPRMRSKGAAAPWRSGSISISHATSSFRAVDGVDGDDRGRAVFGYGRAKCGHRRAVLAGEQVEQVQALDLPAINCPDAGAGQPHVVFLAPGDLEDESVGEHATQVARLDCAPLRAPARRHAAGSSIRTVRAMPRASYATLCPVPKRDCSPPLPRKLANICPGSGRPYGRPGDFLQ